jgi:hypothetical protein
VFIRTKVQLTASACTHGGFHVYDKMWSYEWISTFRKNILLPSSGSELETVFFTDTFVRTYKSTQHHKPEDHLRDLHRCGNLEPRIGRSSSFFLSFLSFFLSFFKHQQSSNSVRVTSVLKAEDMRFKICKSKIYFGSLFLGPSVSSRHFSG